MQLSSFMPSCNTVSRHAVPKTSAKFAAAGTMQPKLTASTGDQVQFQGGLNRLKGKVSEKISGIQQITSLGSESPDSVYFDKALNHAVSYADVAEMERKSVVFDGMISLLEGSDKPNAKKAETELSKAARRGKNMAVAEVYAKGFGVIQPDARKARKYLERAAYQYEWNALKAAIHLAQGFGPMQADPKVAMQFLDKICSKERDLMPYVIRAYEQGLGEITPDADKVAQVRKFLLEGYEDYISNPKAPYLTSGEVLEVIRSYAQSDTTVDKATALLDEMIEAGTSSEWGGGRYSESFINSTFSELSGSETSGSQTIEAFKLVAAGAGKMKADPERADEIAGKLYSTSQDWPLLMQLANLLRMGYGELAPHPKAAMQILHEYVDASTREYPETPKQVLELATRLYKLPTALVDFYLENTEQFPPEDRLF